MRPDNRVDLGPIQIHKKVIADIAYHAVHEIDGVTLIPYDMRSMVYEFLGQKTRPGIAVTVDANHQVSMEVKVLIRYGLNIPEIAGQIQDAVRTAIERSVDVALKDISVNVQGIERGVK